jgi:hypothetical protein
LVLPRRALNLIDGLKGRKPMTNVTVPVELTDELFDEIFKEVLEGETGDFKIIALQRLKYQHSKLVEHFQANPIISDAEKAANFYRAAVCQGEPEYVPSRVNLPHQIERAKGFDASKITLIGPGVYDCEYEQGWAVSIKDESGRTWFLAPGEYEILEWRKNEVDKCGD